MNLLIALPLFFLLGFFWYQGKLSMLAWIAFWMIASAIFLNYAISPPLPASVVSMYLAILFISLLAYASADEERYRETVDPLIRLMTDRKRTGQLALVALGITCLSSGNLYFERSQKVEAPVMGRTIHPAPPSKMSFKGKTLNMSSLENPYRELEKSNPEAFASHVKNGRKVYYQNCVFCHGDNLAGKGIFSHGLDPIPANFQDVGTIAQLQEGFLFWRIAKGGPGLPDESTPWDSSMPAWEKFLSETEIWDVILFLYEFTGHKPRAREEVH